MSDTSGYIVQVLRLGISGTAGLRDASPYMVKDRVPMSFDFDKPAAYLCENPRRAQPTVFASERQAKEQVAELLSRVKAIVRIGQRTGRWVDTGAATQLIPRDFGGGLVGGWEIVEAAGWWAEREEEHRFHAAEAQENLAQADAEVQAAQEKADRLRGEIKPEKPRPSSDVSKWLATDVPKVQRYVRQDGTESFRGRDAGKVSPSFPTLEEAVRWVDGDREPMRAHADTERAEALEGLREAVVRS